MFSSIINQSGFRECNVRPDGGSFPNGPESKLPSHNNVYNPSREILVRKLRHLEAQQHARQEAQQIRDEFKREVHRRYELLKQSQEKPDLRHDDFFSHRQAD